MTKMAILVSSCFKYNDFWKPFFHFFNKAWPNCPYKIYLGTDFGSYSNVSTITTGKNYKWGLNIRFILNKIPENYILLLLEDYFLANQTIDTNKMQEYVDHMEQYNIGCLRLFPCPGPNKPWPHHKELGIINKGEQYRVSLQPAIWDKKTLLSLLIDNEDIWQMEINGSIRSNVLNEYFVSKWRGEGIFPYVMGARKGKWTKEAIEICKKEGLK